MLCLCVVLLSYFLCKIVFMSVFVLYIYVIVCVSVVCVFSCVWTLVFVLCARFFARRLLRLLKNLSGTETSQPGSQVLRRSGSSPSSIDK